MDRRAPLWLALVLALVIAANLIGLAGAVADAPLYRLVSLPFSPVVNVASAGGWTLVFAVVLVGLLARRSWAFAWVSPLLTLYGVTGLVFMAVFARADYDRERIGAQAALTVLLLAPVWWTALRRGWLRPRA